VVEQRNAVGQQPERTGDDGERERRHERRIHRLQLLTALFGTLAAAFGVWGAVVNNENSQLTEAASALEEENAELQSSKDQAVAARDAAEARADEAEAQLEEREDDVPTSTTPPTTIPPSSFLTDLEPVTDGGWDGSRDLNLDGTIYAHGLESDRLGYCGTNGPGIERDIEYSLGRDYEAFHAIAGLSEESVPGLPVKLEVFADGQLVAEHMLNVGQPVTLDLPVEDVLRLRLVATKQFEDPGGCNYVYAALGDPSLE
jgi:hypothetical protein